MAETVQVSLSLSLQLVGSQLLCVHCVSEYHLCVCVRFLGKVMSQYISVCVSEGVRKVSIISEGFNYERWRKTALKNKQVMNQRVRETRIRSC